MTALLIVEFLVKVVALGFCFERSYLSDSWNVLEFGILACSVSQNLHPVRNLRLLRYIFSVSHFQDIGTSAVNSVRSLLALIILAFLLILTYAISGFVIFDKSDDNENDLKSIFNSGYTVVSMLMFNWTSIFDTFEE